VNTDDRRLIAECLAGRTAAFGELVRRYQDRLFNAVVRVVDTAEDAADVVQDAFLNAFQSLNSFKGDSEFFTWLYRIAFNAAISLRRKKKAVLSFDGDDRAATEPADPSEYTRPGVALERAAVGRTQPPVARAPDGAGAEGTGRTEVRGHRRGPRRADRDRPQPAAPGSHGTERPATPTGVTWPHGMAANRL
jgi:RNA polymerase sigma factor (sigma-70 family)